MSWPDNPVLDQDRSDIPINENFDALKAKADEHAATIATQASTLATNTSAIASQGARLTTAEGTLVSQGSRLTSAEGTIVSLDSRLDSAEPTIAANSLSVAAHQARIAQMRPRGVKTAMLGDSITIGQSVNATNQHKAFAIPTMLWLLSNGRMRFMRGGNLGVSGNTTAQMLARVNDVLALNPDICVVLGGDNDVFQAIATTTTINNLRTIAQTLQAAGIMPVLCTIPPVDAVYLTNQRKLNAAMRKLADDVGAPLADIHSVCVSGADGLFKTGYSYDGNHPTRYGAGFIGQKIIDDLSPILLPQSPTLTTYATDPINLLANGVFIGDANADGIADSWSGTPSATRLFAIETDANQVGNWQSMEVTTTGTAMGLIQSVNASGKFSAGDVLAFSGVIRTDHVGNPGDDGNAYIRPTVWLEFTGGTTSAGVGTTYVVDQLGWDIASPGRTFYIETVVPSGATAVAARVTSGSTGSGKIRCARFTLLNLTALGMV